MVSGMADKILKHLLCFTFVGYFLEVHALYFNLMSGIILISVSLTSKPNPTTCSKFQIAFIRPQAIAENK